MSRSNNSGRGGYAPQAQPPHQQQPHQQSADEHWRHPLDQADGGHLHPAPPPPHWGPPQQQTYAPDPYAPAPQHAGYPQASHDPYGQPHAAPQQGYAPAYPAADGFTPHHDAHGNGGLASYSPQPNQELSTFSPPSQWPQPPAHDPRFQDPRGNYDLGGYAPGTGQAGGHGHAPVLPVEPAFSHDPYAPATARTQPSSGWQHMPAPQHGAGQEPHFGHGPAGYGDAQLRPQQPLQPQGYAPAPGYPAAQGAALDSFGQSLGAATAEAPGAHTGEYDDEDYEDEDDEQPRRGRTLLIVGALVGAIFVGGGLAYTYRALTGGAGGPSLASGASKSRASAATVKVAEQAPKLPEVAPKSQVASAESDPSGPRRVTTIPVGPDGSTQAAPPPVVQPQTITMPGLAVTMPPAAAPQRDAALPPPQPLPQARPQPAPPPPPVVQAPALQPKVITPPPPPQKQAAVAEPKPPKELRRVAKAKENDAYSPGGATASVATATAAPAAKSSGATNGYVAAILSTPKGQVEAMKAFADLQSKYPDVLNGKPAEVQEKNLGEAKGIWYRAVVGPPGSYAGAKAVCDQLKAAGYTHCFATAY